VPALQPEQERAEMRRSRVRPVVEGLEAKALMSGLTNPAVDSARVSEPGPVALTISTDRTVYQAGQPVTMILTETNTSRQTVRIYDGPSFDGFFLTRNGVTVWRSNPGPQILLLRWIDLAPGQSYTLRATWDGHPNTELGMRLPGTPAGIFEVHSQVTQDHVSAAPVTITVRPAPVPSEQPLVVSVTTDRASYRVGQSVAIRLTETNTSSHDVPALFGARILNATVTGPKGPVWQFRDLRASLTFLGVLHAGQSRTFTLTWNGAPDLPGAAVVPGAYTVRAGVDSVSGAARFALV
jgi:hypothetical protein